MIIMAKNAYSVNIQHRSMILRITNAFNNVEIPKTWSMLIWFVLKNVIIIYTLDIRYIVYKIIIYVRAFVKDSMANVNLVKITLSIINV